MRGMEIALDAMTIDGMNKLNEMNNLNRDNLNNELEINNIGEEQRNFFDSALGKAVNFGLDIGIKAALPDIIEDVVIDIKNTILEAGLKDGLKDIVDSVFNVGKSVLGITTGKFDNISQIEIAVKQGGIIENISKFLNIGIDKAVSLGALSPEIGSIIRSGKTAILSATSDKLKASINNQFKAFEKLEKQMDRWNKNFNEQSIDKMKRNVNNINKLQKQLMPFENILEKSKQINLMQDWIEKNKSFDIPESMTELFNKI